MPKHPDCKAKALTEFLRRMDYVQASYGFALMFAKPSFNESLALLRRAVGSLSNGPSPGTALHPYLQVATNLHAQRFAEKRTGMPNAKIIAADVADAARHVAATARPMRGRPRSHPLDHHVAGLMALIQQTGGSAVTAIRETSANGYGPKLPGVSRILLHVFSEVDPSITETQLVNKVLEVRRTYAGKTMRFLDFFPLYGATIDTEGNPVCVPPVKLESFTRLHPIYCR